jgi:hypothetical protein
MESGGQYPVNTDGSIRQATRAALVFASWLAFAFPGILRADTECELPERMSMSAAGHWKGFYRIIVEMKVASVFPVVTSTKIEGSLEFDLGRYEAPEAPNPSSSPPSDLRTPLGWKAASPSPAASTSPTGWATTSVTREEFEKACGVLHETLPADTEVTDEAIALAKKIMAQTEGNYQGLSVGPNENPKIEGKATYNRQDSISISGVGHESGGTSAPATLEVRAEGDQDFKEIGLWGFPDQMAYGYNGVAGGNPVGIDIDGGLGNWYANNHSGTVTSDVSHSQTELVSLNVVNQECWLMQGTVENRFSSAGFEAVVTDSEWTATLDERDVDFEKRVQALADEPIPSPLTWDYVNHFNGQWQSLRNSGKLTNYRLCVLKDLDRKAVAITVAGLQELLNDFPKVRDMDSACAALTVVSAALERILPLVRRLQLEGIQCPLIANNEWLEVVNKELRDLVKNTLARTYLRRTRLPCESRGGRD